MKTNEKYYYKKADGSNCFIFSRPSHVSDYIEITKEQYDAFIAQRNQPAPIHEPRQLTQAELELRAKKREIAQLKRKLAETDYCVIKIAEGVAQPSEYADVLAQRQQWRARINQLQEE